MVSPPRTEGRRGLRALTLASLLLASPLGAEVIVKKAGSGGLDVLADALAKALDGSGTVRTIELTSDEVADRARLSREVGSAQVLFTVGPEATEAAGGVGPSVVSLGVPNPARVRTAGSYVSLYPRLEAVCQFIQAKLGAKSLGLVFNPNESRELAVAFLAAGARAGVTIEPVAVKSDGEIARAVKAALPKVDVLVLLTDRLVFSKRNFSDVVAEARAAKKPTIAFIEGADQQGVTVTLVAPADATATAAVAAALTPQVVGKKRIEVDGMTVTVSKKEAQALGINPDTLGAQRVR